MVADPQWFNGLMLVLLRSPLHWLLDPGLCELRYQGHRSGRRVALPAIYALDEQRVIAR